MQFMKLYEYNFKRYHKVKEVIANDNCTFLSSRIIHFHSANILPYYS